MLLRLRILLINFLSQFKPMTTKKITEFKLYPTAEQSAKIDLWLTQLKWVWNTGLSLLEESQQREWRTKQEWTEPSPEKWQWFKNTDGVFGLCCPYYGDRSAIRKHQDIETPYKAVKNYHFIANMRCPDFLHPIDSESRRSVVDSLIDSWTQYRKGKRGKPRYKGKADKLESFANGNGRTLVKIIATSDRDNAYIDYPKLGQIKCKGLFRRYAGNHTIVRIVKRADGCYVQFTSTVDEKPVKPAKKEQVGLDFGVIAPIADSDGRLHKSKRYAKLQAKKLAKLQRSICRSVNGSNRLKAKRQKLAKTHLKIARQRDRFIHKLTSKYVSEYQQIAIEDTKVKNMVRAPKPKQDESTGAYLPNGAAAKAGLNKSLHDVAIGKMKTMLETKSKASQRVFVKVPAPHTSQGCAECGYYSEKFRPNQATFKCLNCGNSDNADTNASKVIRNIAFTGLVLKPYSASSEEVKDVDRASHGKKRQPNKTRKSKKGSGGETSPAINRESGGVQSADALKPLPDIDLHPQSSSSIRANPTTQSQQDFEVWQDLKPDDTHTLKNRCRNRSAQNDTSNSAQLGFWDLTVAIEDEIAS